MGNKKVVIVIFVLLSFCKSSHSWFFKNTDREKVEKSSTVDIPDDVPFEMQTSDERFLMLADFVKDLSPLEACHHLVVAEIEETCGDISEETLGKLAVNLLNCQSQSEGRQVYPCTGEMTIAECTRDMDSTVWNTYQIVSNRARALCYNTRQQQFRMKTEATVNKLMYSAAHQVHTMGSIKKGQDDLIGQAAESLAEMKSERAELISQQEKLRGQQVSIQSSIAVTLRDLYREKALIASGHKEYTEMTEVLKQKLDNATDMLVSQQDEQRENHKEILQDLSHIHHKTRDVWQRIDEGNQQVLEFQRETSEHYRETLESLEKVNNTVTYVMRLLNHTHTVVESKLNWILQLIGASGDTMDLLLTVSLHLLYLLLAACAAAFLHTPAFSRLLLLALVPLNAWSQLKTGRSLGFLPMTLFILLSTAANWVVGWVIYLTLCRKTRRPAHTELPGPPSPPPLAVDQAPVGGQEGDVATGGRRGSESSGGGQAERQREGQNMRSGLTGEQLQKLVHMLQELHASGMLTPDRDLASPLPSYPGDQHVPVNTPVSAPGGAGEEGTSFSFPAKPATIKPEQVAKETPGRKSDRFKSLPTSSPRVDLVKRHLMKTLADELNCTTESEADAFQAPPTPSDSRTSTPCGTPRSTRKRGGEGLNQSLSSRAQCLATTKAGMPCRNTSVDGSAFCRRHQVA